MSGTTSFEPNNRSEEVNRVEAPRPDGAADGAPAGDSTGHGGCRSSFLELPTRSFFSARELHHRKTGCGSCRNRGRRERVHRSLENRQGRGFPQLPQALTLSFGNPKCYPCSRLTLLPMFPVAPHTVSRSANTVAVQTPITSGGRSPAGSGSVPSARAPFAYPRRCASASPCLGGSAYLAAKWAVPGHSGFAS